MSFPLISLDFLNDLSSFFVFEVVKHLQIFFSSIFSFIFHACTLNNNDTQEPSPCQKASPFDVGLMSYGNIKLVCLFDNFPKKTLFLI